MSPIRCGSTIPDQFISSCKAHPQQSRYSVERVIETFSQPGDPIPLGWLHSAVKDQHQGDWLRRCLYPFSQTRRTKQFLPLPLSSAESLLRRQAPSNSSSSLAPLCVRVARRTHSKLSRVIKKPTVQTHHQEIHDLFELYPTFQKTSAF